MNNSKSLNITYVEECKTLQRWTTPGQPVTGMAVFWLLACLISTICNSTTVYAIRQTRTGHFRTFDICLLNLFVTHLIPANIMFISAAARNIDPSLCTARSILGLAFSLFTFVKIITLVVISFNQAANLHKMTSIHAQPHTSNNTIKRAIKVSAIWSTAALLVVIPVTTTVRWHIIVSIFAIILVMLRVYVIRKLSSYAQSIAGVDWKIATMERVKKSKRMTFVYFMVELVTWIPAILAVAIARIASKDAVAVAVVSRYAFIPVFLGPPVYAVATIYWDSNLRSYVQSMFCQRTNNQVQAII